MTTPARLSPARVDEIRRWFESCPSNICDPECEGRCRECPADVIRELLAEREHVSALLTDGKELVQELRARCRSGCVPRVKDRARCVPCEATDLLAALGAEGDETT